MVQPSFYVLGSGKGAVLPPPPPLRTGRESFPSSGSSRYKAPCDRSRFSRRFFRHSFHGQGFCRERMGEQPLQSFHFAVAALPCCLDDTRLQPSDLASTLGPVYLFPCFRLAGGCTRGLLCVHLQFPPTNVLPTLSSRTTRWKSARFRGEVELLSAPLQNGLGFFQHPLPAIPSAFLADAPASCGRRNVGFTMFDCNDTDELSPASHTGSCLCPFAPEVRSSNQLRAFWPEPVSIFGSRT
jgi:hypothetical protein